MTKRTRIKVCGITRPEDAQDAIESGADCLGFIFAPQSPRKIEPETAREIIKDLPPFVDAAGVFMDEEAAVVGEIIQYCGLTVAQFHGSESPDYCNEFPGRVIKAFRIGSFSEDSQLAPYAGTVQGFLLDTYSRSMAGGTGEVFDWQMVDKLDPPGPVILAGGLNPENVEEAICTAQPFAVDVNSGIEIEPGIKDTQKLKKFIEVVRKTDARLNGYLQALA